MKKTATVLVAVTLATVMAVVPVAGCNKSQLRAQAAGAAEARLDSLVIPDGTSVIATLDLGLSTETNRTGDPFTMTTIGPIALEGRTVVPAGACINGVLHDVLASGPVPGQARLTLAYLQITDLDGRSWPITAEPLALMAGPTTRADVERIAADDVLGAVFGAVDAGGNGAAIDAASGAEAGTAVMLATTGAGIVVEAGQKVNVRMTSPMVIQVLAWK